MDDQQRMTYEDLDEATRLYMVQEIEADVDQDALRSPSGYFTSENATYSGFLIKAAKSGTDESLANDIHLRIAGRTKPASFRNGKATPGISLLGARKIAEWDFNRFYMRGVCCRAIADNIGSVFVYHAHKNVELSAAAQKLIGQSLDPQKALDDLRLANRDEILLERNPATNEIAVSICLPRLNE